MVFKNNLKVILGSKSGEFKGIEARKKLGTIIEKECINFTFQALHYTFSL